MTPFTYHRAENSGDALRALGEDPSAKFIGGGTNLLDLMKENVERPRRLVDVNHIGSKDLTLLADGRLSIGATVTNAAAAYHPLVKRHAPLLSDAILAGASPQLRNMATCGGNLLQRTRCYYFYDTAAACNKREPGAGCDALKGFNRIHAVLGASDACIAVHPSDMCVALAALDARVKVAGPEGERTIAFEQFHRLPGERPDLDNTLARDEIVLAIEIPPSSGRHHYLKVRDRSSYAFALVSAAVVIRLDGDKIVEARAAMGGVAHKPWRDREAERKLLGRAAGREAFREFANAFFGSARGYGSNDYKLALGPRALVRAFEEAVSAGMAS